MVPGCCAGVRTKRLINARSSRSRHPRPRLMFRWRCVDIVSCRPRVEGTRSSEREYHGTSGLPPSARHRSDCDGQEMLLSHQATPAELFAFRVVDGGAVDLPGSNQAAMGL